MVRYLLVQSVCNRFRIVEGDKPHVKAEAERMVTELELPVTVWEYCSTVSYGLGEPVWPEKERAERK